jgi:hypothetical protein
MATEFDRRDRLMDKCLDLANLAMKQEDMSTAEQMLRKATELYVIQLKTLELMQPGSTKEMKAEFVALFKAKT